MSAPEITFEFVAPRKITQMGLMRGGKDLKKSVAEGKQIYFEVSNATKTLLNTSVVCGDINLSVNYEIEGIKTQERSNYNYFSYTTTYQNHFKLSKKQGINEYKEYLKGVISEISRIIGEDIKQTHFIVFGKVFLEETV